MHKQRLLVIILIDIPTDYRSLTIRSHGVMVSTPDSESGNPSSNLGGTFLCLNV